MLVQKVDGATLVTLATGSNVSLQQLQSCGFETVADQLKLKRLVEDDLPSHNNEPIKIEQELDMKEGLGRKLTIKEIKALKPEEHHMYKMM